MNVRSSGADQAPRPSWDQYFISLAGMVARRSTCLRRMVGAVIVRDRRILATGYNGSPPGFVHCTDVGCLEVDGHCVRTIHAEVNAIVQAALHGVGTQGATLYCTDFPCLNCTKMLIGAGIVRVVYRDEYDDPRSRAFLREAAIETERLANPEAGAQSGQTGS